MASEVIVALISGAFTFLGVAITTHLSNRKTQAIVEYRINELTEEVKMHNNFARRMPVVEEKIDVMNHRIKDLEEETKHERKN